MRKSNTKIIVSLAMFTAIAYVCTFVLKIQGIGGFLTFDIKDAIITVAAMIFGPVSGVLISFAVSLIEMVTISGTGPWGFLMNFVASAFYSVTASVVYRYMPKIKRTLAGAITGLLMSVLSMTAVMLIMNLLITPIYMNIPREAVKALIPTLLLPFNLLKGITNAALVMVLYKPIKAILIRAKLVAERENSQKYKFDKTAIILTVAGVVVIAICCVLLILSMDGTFKIIK